MKSVLEEIENFVVIVVDGILVSTTFAILEYDLEKALNDYTKDVILNLENVSFVDSSGINLLIKYKRKLQEKERKLMIHNLNKDVARIFELLGLFKFFKIELH